MKKFTLKVQIPCRLNQGGQARIEVILLTLAIAEPSYPLTSGILLMLFSSSLISSLPYSGGMSLPDTRLWELGGLFVGHFAPSVRSFTGRHKPLWGILNIGPGASLRTSSL